MVEKNGGKSVNTGLDRNTFRGILHNIFGMTDDMLMNRVFFVFDKDKDNHINATEWVKGLSVFLRGTFEEKLKFCFEVYYMNGDGYISQEKIFEMLKNSLCQQSSEEEDEDGIKELVDLTMKKMDYDNDGKISFADFEKAVKKDGLLLEAFGPCLPEAKPPDIGNSSLLPRSNITMLVKMRMQLVSSQRTDRNLLRNTESIQQILPLGLSEEFLDCHKLYLMEK